MGGRRRHHNARRQLPPRRRKRGDIGGNLNFALGVHQQIARQHPIGQTRPAGGNARRHHRRSCRRGGVAHHLGNNRPPAAVGQGCRHFFGSPKIAQAQRQGCRLQHARRVGENHPRRQQRRRRAKVARKPPRRNINVRPVQLQVALNAGGDKRRSGNFRHFRPLRQRNQSWQHRMESQRAVLRQANAVAVQKMHPLHFLPWRRGEIDDRNSVSAVLAVSPHLVVKGVRRVEVGEKLRKLQAGHEGFCRRGLVGVAVSGFQHHRESRPRHGVGGNVEIAAAESEVQLARNFNNAGESLVGLRPAGQIERDVLHHQNRAGLRRSCCRPHRCRDFPAQIRRRRVGQLRPQIGMPRINKPRRHRYIRRGACARGCAPLSRNSHPQNAVRIRPLAGFNRHPSVLRTGLILAAKYMEVGLVCPGNPCIVVAIAVC